MTKIDGVLFKRMLLSGGNNLYNHYPEVDSLNVFPIPDGDTGTNMNLTFSSGSSAVFAKNETSISDVAKTFAHGLIFGARGNSGVITSQIFGGFAKGLEGKAEVDAITFANAWMTAKDVAYRTVKVPVEGTILTVIREASQALYEKVEKDMSIAECMDILYEEALHSLKRTPDLLPVLKEAGVVDSGGTGLCYILEGFKKALHNEIVEKSMPQVTDTVPTPNKVSDKDKENIKVQYCVQAYLELSHQDPLPLNKKAFKEDRFKALLEAYGENIAVVNKDNVIRLKVDTFKPGSILTYAQQYGEFTKVSINVKDENEEYLFDDFKVQEMPHKNYALIAVGVGKGIEQLFKELSVDIVVSGGQTMNPATKDFVDAIEKLNADTIFIFPNNGNIYLAASQAAEFVKDHQKVIVIPTKTINEGLVACMVFNPEADVEDNIASMKENISSVKSGEITYAVKDTTIDGVTVAKDHFMGIQGKKILCCHKHKVNTLFDMLTQMVDEDSQIITIIFGEDVKDDEKKAVTDYVQTKYGDYMDISLADGLQPVYSFLVSVE